jgi:hypothetical protein
MEPVGAVQPHPSIQAPLPGSKPHSTRQGLNWGTPTGRACHTTGWTLSRRATTGFRPAFVFAGITVATTALRSYVFLAQCCNLASAYWCSRISFPSRRSNPPPFVTVNAASVHGSPTARNCRGQGKGPSVPSTRCRCSQCHQMSRTSSP